MIETLRKKFILTNMALVSAVLLAVLLFQGFSVYRQAARQVYNAQLQSLEMLSSNDLPPRFIFGRGRSQLPEGQSLPEPREPRGQNFLGVPTFAVEINWEGRVILLQAGPGVEVTQETAQAMADAALARADDQGSLPSEHLDYLYRFDNDRRFLSFADNTSVGQALRRQALISLAILLGALAAFYLISRHLAKRSLEPVERAWEQQRQFVADASHELKTPITVILANSDIVQAHPGETVESQRKWLGYIQDEAARMKVLVEDLLFLAKSDAAQLASTPAVIQLDQLVTGALLPFESVAFEAGVTLTDHLTEGLTVTGDESQLRRLVVILLDNAVKYAGEGGSVTVILERMGDQPRLTVHNSGPAIPCEHLEHLFERFYRADAARDREHGAAPGGYGLGLAIAKSIADHHGGTISVTSAPEVGTTFTVVLPKGGRKK